MSDVYVILVSVIDHEEMGIKEVERLIETNRYISPKVEFLQRMAIEWDDDHPLNKPETSGKELAKMFPSVQNLV